MDNFYAQYWRDLRRPSRFGRAVVLSIVLHGLVAVAVWQYVMFRPPRPPERVYNISIIPDSLSEQAMEAPEQLEPVEEEAVPEPEAEPEPPKPAPEPEAKPEPPEPEPTPEPEPEPEPDMPEPEPAPEPVPEKAAPEVKEAKKEDPPKEAPKPEPPEREQKVEVKPAPTADPEFEKMLLEDLEPEPQPERTQVAKNTAPTKPAVGLQRQLPSVLNFWGRQVQKKVESRWEIPGGIPLDKDDSEAIISFYVDRHGNLLGAPQIVKQGSDSRLAQSGVKAIMDAAPFPPLPENYAELEQEVIYVFSLE